MYISLIGLIHFTIYISQVTFSFPKVYTFQLDFISNKVGFFVNLMDFLGTKNEFSKTQEIVSSIFVYIIETNL